MAPNDWRSGLEKHSANLCPCNRCRRREWLRRNPVAPQPGAHTYAFTATDANAYTSAYAFTCADPRAYAGTFSDTGTFVSVRSPYSRMDGSQRVSLRGYAQERGSPECWSYPSMREVARRGWEALLLSARAVARGLRSAAAWWASSW
jgi:hypothetical protein